MDKPNFTFPKPEASPGFLLWQVSNLWQKAMRAALKESGLSHNQFVALAGLLWHQKEQKKLTQNTLAAFTKMDAMVISTVVRQLEKLEYLIRKKSEQDQRAFDLELTVKGSEIVKVALPKVEAADEQFFRGLITSKPEFLTQLQSLTKN